MRKNISCIVCLSACNHNNNKTKSSMYVNKKLISLQNDNNRRNILIILTIYIKHAMSCHITEQKQ